MQDSSLTCPLCHHPGPKTWPIANVPGLHRCENCDFIFAPNIESENASLYDSAFGATNVHPTYEKRNGQFVVRNRIKLESYLKQLEPYHRTGRILDVGCSAAFFLAVARDKGWQPQGVEIAEWAAEFSRKELGIPVFNGLLNDASFPDDHFDVVFSSHVMEHISDPSELLREMARVLKPGGLHMTVVPTQFASPSWRLARRFIGDPPPIHASFYTRDTFAKLLTKAGLSILNLNYNVELSRIRDLLRSESESVAAWRNQKAMTINGVSSIGKRPFWSSPAKWVFNLIGNHLGMGDELIALAQKPLPKPL